MNVSHSESRQQIIALLRGQAACPMIAGLAKLGIAQQMLTGSFKTTSFNQCRNHSLLESCFTYLHSLGLLVAGPEMGEYRLTELGNTVFRRSGAFLLLHSYHRYFDSLPDLLQNTRTPNVSVDRELNVLGSGSLHRRKYFSTVDTFFEDCPPKAWLDLGCGDGAFLEYCCSLWPELRVAAVDLSPLAVQMASRRIAAFGKHPERVVVADASAVKSWADQIPEVMRQSSFVISLWFVAHEFSGGRPETLVRFFHALRSELGSAEIVLGEIVEIPPDTLADNCRISIMPEFLFFHDLSGQGVLSWDAWNDVLKTIPYSLVLSKTFDEVEDTRGVRIPSSFVWHLRPM